MSSALEQRLADTSRHMHDLEGALRTPGGGGGGATPTMRPATPTSAQRRLQDSVAGYRTRLQALRSGGGGGAADTAEGLCAELLARFEEAEAARADAAAKVAAQQKELDAATRMVRQQQSLVAAGLVGRGGPRPSTEALLAQHTLVMRELQAALRNVQPQRELSALSPEIQDLHTGLGATDFAAAAADVRCRVETLLDDVMKPASPPGAAAAAAAPVAAHPSEEPWQRRAAGLHGSVLQLLGLFGGAEGRHRGSEASAGLSETLAAASADVERLSAAAHDALAGLLARLGRATEVITGERIGSSGGGADSFATLAGAVEKMNAFADKAAAELEAMTSSTGTSVSAGAALPGTPGRRAPVAALIAKAHSQWDRRLAAASSLTPPSQPSQPPQPSVDALRAKQLGTVAATLLSALSPEDAAHLAGAEAEATLRACLAHADRLRRSADDAAQEAADARARAAAAGGRLAHVDNMLGEILVDPAAADGGSGGGDELSSPILREKPVEAKLATLHGLYQEKRDKLFELEDRLRACNRTVNTLLAQHDRSDVVLEPLPQKMAVLQELLDENAGGGGGGGKRRHDDVSDLSSDTEDLDVHRVYGLLKSTAGDVMPPGVSARSVEAAIAQLNARVRGAEKRAADLDTQLRRYVARVQSLVQAYDHRSPSRRHVHLGDLDSPADGDTPGLDDVEALLETLARGGGIGGVPRRDALLDSVEADLRAILPHVESMVGVPPWASALITTPRRVGGGGGGGDPHAPGSGSSEGKLQATLARWRRVLDHHRSAGGGAAAVAHGERVLLRTLQHVASRLRAALSGQDLPEHVREHGGDAAAQHAVDSVEAAVGELDRCTAGAAEAITRLGAERTRVLATMHTVIAAAQEGQSGAKAAAVARHVEAASESEVVSLSQLAAAWVADLVGRYSGAHTRLQRLSTTVLQTAQTVDKVLPAGAPASPAAGGGGSAEARSMSLGRRSEDVPEHVLQEAVGRLATRAAKARAAVAAAAAQREADGDEDAEEDGGEEGGGGGWRPRLRALAVQAPNGAGVAQLVSCVAARVAAVESDRAALRKEGERARAAWRRLHDDVTRRLGPLVELLPDQAEPRKKSSPAKAAAAASAKGRSPSPPLSAAPAAQAAEAREERDEAKKAHATIQTLEQQVRELHRTQQLTATDLTGQKSRRMDLEGRLKSVSKVNARAAKEMCRLCALVGVSAVPVADELSTEVDLALTATALFESTARLAETSDDVCGMRERVAVYCNEAEEARTRAAKVELQHLHLLNAVTDVLTVLDLMPEAAAAASPSASSTSATSSSSSSGSSVSPRAVSSGHSRSTRAASNEGPRKNGSGGGGSGGGGPSQPEEWEVLVGGVAKLLQEVRDGRKARARVDECEAAVDAMVAGILGAGGGGSGGAVAIGGDHRFSLSPLTTEGRRSPSPDGRQQQQQQQDGRVVDVDGLRRRCAEVEALFREARQSVENERRLVDEAAEAAQAFARIDSIVSGGGGGFDAAGGSAPDPAATADKVHSKVGHLIEVSAAAASEKAKLIRQNLELKQGAEGLREDVDEMRATIREAQEASESARRKLEAAQMFVAYAKEMVDDEDSGGDEGRAADGSDDDEDADGGFKEVTAVRAYQAYLTVRKEREALRRRVDELENESEGAQLQEEFLGGISAKVVALEGVCSDVLLNICGKAGGEGGRGPSRSPPARPDGNPATIIGSLKAIERSLQLFVTESSAGLDNLDDAAACLQDVAAEADVTLPADVERETLSIASAARFLETSLEALREGLAARRRREHLRSAGGASGHAEEGGGGGSSSSRSSSSSSSDEPLREQQDNTSPQRRPPQHPGQGPPRHPAPALGSAGAGAGEMTAYERQQLMAQPQDVSPPRNPHGADEVQMYEVERSMLSTLNKLEEIAGSTAASRDDTGSSLLSLAKHLDFVCETLCSELAYIAPAVLPAQPLLDALKDALAKAAAPALEARELAQLTEGVKGVVTQLTSIGDVVAAAAPKDCAKLLLRSAKRGDTDPLGLLAGIRRLHTIVANKVEHLPRELRDQRARAETLEAQVSALEARTERKELTALTAAESEEHAKEKLATARAHWETQRRALEDKLRLATEGRDVLQEQLDAAQSALALNRNGSRNRSPPPPPYQAQPRQELLASPPRERRHVSPPRGGSRHPQEHTVSGPSAEEVHRLEEEVRTAAERYDEIKVYVDRLTEKLDEKDRSKRDYKEKYRLVLQEMDVLEDEKNELKKSFAAQLNAVKAQLIKLQGSGRSRTHTPGGGGGGATRDVLPREVSNRNAVTVPREFNLTKATGRTGCWVCDAAEGQSAPPHTCRTRGRGDAP